MSDKVEKLEETGAKKVSVKTDNGTEEYLFKGDVNELLADLAKKTLNDVTITEPGLEEIFMNYYE